MSDEPIKIDCPCGKAFQVKAKARGRVVKCPACQRDINVPNITPPLPQSSPPAGDLNEAIALLRSINRKVNEQATGVETFFGFAIIVVGFLAFVVGMVFMTGSDSAARAISGLGFVYIGTNIMRFGWKLGGDR